MEDIADNITQVRRKIATARLRRERTGNITVVGVSKNVPVKG